ncbi:MAG: hypothetical protein R3B47_11840 [Bacteroidia bacterium]
MSFGAGPGDAGKVYSVSISAEDGACPQPGTASKPFKIAVPTSCSLGLTAVVTDASCTDNGAIDLSLGTAVTPLRLLSWSGPGGFTSNNEDLTGLAPGNYTVSGGWK